MRNTIIRLVQVITGISAVVFPVFIGYQTLEQSEQFHAAQQHSDKLARTAQIMSSFYSSHSIQNLSQFANRLDVADNARIHIFDNTVKYIDLYYDLSRDNSEDIRGSVIHFIRTLDTVYYCGWVDDVLDNISCDKNLLFSTYFDEITWMFNRIRPGIYCDHAIQHLFDYSGNVEEDSAIYRLETMILDYLRSDIHLVRHPQSKREDYMRVEPYNDQSNSLHGLRPNNTEIFCQRSDRSNESAKPDM